MTIMMKMMTIMTIMTFYDNYDNDDHNNYDPKKMLPPIRSHRAGGRGERSTAAGERGAAEHLLCPMYN